MAEEFPRPRLFVSKCLEFAPCRWNGEVIRDARVRALAQVADLAPHCPEVEIGLGIPRAPLRIVDQGQGPRLVQPSTGRDVTGEMTAFLHDLFRGLGEVDGAVLKNRSPSCGPWDVKHYRGAEPGAASRRGPGLFGGAWPGERPGTPLVDEGRLRNFGFREHFYTQVFTLARFRQAREEGGRGSLVDFHSRAKLLLLAYNQDQMRQLGRVVAKQDQLPPAAGWAAYGEGLSRALATRPKVGGHVNVVLHALGYFSRELSREEKAHFLDLLQNYRDHRLPLSALLVLLQSWIKRFEQPYLAGQIYFRPYPASLLEIADSGKGRGRVPRLPMRVGGGQPAD
ncbi:MAG: DUF523 and DUF1722 domain-containing protein [Deltaproteobacteria bacterium]|nr:DUF523 and DUF1722 domain-containing protein [Deltaproteobacteria bacterium]